MSKRNTASASAIEYAFSETAVTPCFYIRAGKDPAVRLHYVGPGFLLMRHEQDHKTVRRGCKDSIADHFLTAEPWFRRRHMRPILRNTDVLGHGCSLRHRVIGDDGSNIIKYLKKMAPEKSQVDTYKINKGVNVFEITIPTVDKEELIELYRMLMNNLGNNVKLTEHLFALLGLEWVIKKNNFRVNRTLAE